VLHWQGIDWLNAGTDVAQLCETSATPRGIEKMKWNQFGETVEGYTIPVLNEREVRAAAGILFFFMYTALLLILFTQNFLLIKYMITLFLLDFIIRMFVSPRYSPTLIIGRMFVSRQNPEYVGAQQKRFAWGIGLGLALIMFALMVLLNSYSIITGIICLICLIFLFFEAVFGICLGCMVYPWIYRAKAQYCPGEICDVKQRTDIQRISLVQFGVVAGFALFLLATIYLFNDSLSAEPSDLFAKLNAHSRVTQVQE
jgi:hypothetical protein